MSAPEKYPPILVEIYEHILALINKNNMFSAHSSDDAALIITDTIRRNFGGAMMYIPKSSGMTLQQRDREIFSKYNYKNVSELAKEYDLSVQCIYRVIKRVSAEKSAVSQ